MLRTCGVIACVTALLFGCAASDAESTDPIESSEPGDPEASGEPTAPGEPEEPGDPDAPVGGPCDAEVVAAVDATVAGQLEAFADDDFEAAIGFASRSFREGIDVAAFRALILEAYPNLADTAVHRSGACQITEQGVAEVRIEVTGQGGTRDDHLYRMVAEDGDWLVDAAVTPDGTDQTLT